MKRLCEPGQGIDIVHLGGLQQGGDGRPCAAATVAAGEQGILSRNGLWPDGAFDDVGVDLDTAVDEEVLQGYAAR